MFRFCAFKDGIDIITSGIVPMAIVRVVNFRGVYSLSIGLERTVYVAQHIGFAIIRRSPIKLWSAIFRAFPEPIIIRIMPMKEIIMLCIIGFVIFSTPNMEPMRTMNIGVVASIREELLAVVLAIPWMKKSW